MPPLRVLLTTMKSSRSFPLLAAALCAGLASCGPDQVPYEGPLDTVAIHEFTPDHDEIRPADTTWLKWATRDALFVQLEDGTGTVLGGDDLGIVTGTFEISPRRTTRYKLTAFGASGSQRFAYVKVVVDEHDPEVTLEAEKTTIPFGESTVLEWKVSGAIGVRLLADDKPLLEDAGEEGSLEVSPEHTTHYVLEATGPGGTRSAEVRIKVAPVIASFFSSPSGPQLEGTKVRLFWTTTGADSVRLEGKDFEYAAPAERIESGALQVDAGVGKISLIASREGVETTAEVVVPFLVAPVIDRFTAPAEVTAGPGRPGNLTIAWKVTGAATVSLLRSDRDEPLALEPEGNLEIDVEESAVLTLVAANPAGEVTKQLEVKAFAPAVIRDFEVSPDHLDAPGGKVRITWSTTDAIYVRIEKGGISIAPDDLGPSGRIDLDVDKTTVFRLIAVNEAGTRTEESRTVTVGAPAAD